MKQLTFFLLITLATHVSFAQASLPSDVVATVPTSDAQEVQALLLAAPPPRNLKPGDTISAQIFGIKDFSFEQQVPANGVVDFPLAGSIPVAGYTVQQVQHEFRNKLIELGMLDDPQVTVVAVKRPGEVVTVSGAVPKPGLYPAVAGLSLADYLSEAGGSVTISSGVDVGTPIAKMNVTLFRPSIGRLIHIPLDNNNASTLGRIPIFPGDDIRVPRAGSVYAFGALKTQGSYPLKGDGPTTVLQLVAMAGGLGYEANASNAYIVRTQGTLQTAIAVPIRSLIKKHEPGPTLVEDDILYVPTSTLRAAIKGGGASLIISLANSYLYTH